MDNERSNVVESWIQGIHNRVKNYRLAVLHTSVMTNSGARCGVDLKCAAHKNSLLPFIARISSRRSVSRPPWSAFCSSKENSSRSPVPVTHRLSAHSPSQLTQLPFHVKLDVFVRSWRSTLFLCTPRCSCIAVNRWQAFDGEFPWCSPR